MKINQWNIQEDAKYQVCYASWKITFFTKTMSSRQALWEFIKELLIIGEKYEVAQITETGSEDEEPCFNINEGESFIEFADRTLQENPRVIWQPCQNPHIATKLSYYDEFGNVIENYVSSLPSIIDDDKRFHLSKSNAIEFDYNCGHKYDDCTVDEKYGLLNFEFLEDGEKYSASVVEIKLNTDIWFAMVEDKNTKYSNNLVMMNELERQDYNDLSLQSERTRNYLSLCYRKAHGETNIWEFKKDESGKWLDEEGEEWHDNSELALRHTPRLNKFIEYAKQLTAKYGGTWTSQSNRYSCQWNEDGIILDREKFLPKPQPIEISSTVFSCNYQNKWKASSRFNYARWRAVFPSKQMIDKTEFWAFLEGVVILATKYEVLQFLEVGEKEPANKYYFNVNSGESFIDFASRILEQENILIFDSPRKGLSKLCFYNKDNEIISQKVLSPERIQARVNGTRSHYNTSAIQFYTSLGFATRRNYDTFIENGVKYAPSSLLLFTKTNIWFPKVLALKDPDDPNYELAWYDNSALALCHTPRFNKFVQGVKQLTIQYGGVWIAEKDDRDCDKDYLDQWNEDGIFI
jgi:hypothetical protein